MTASSNRVLKLSFHRTLTDSDSKQHLPFPFQVPAGTTQLSIRLTFSPWTVNGINNLLTLTVFDPSGWRGTGHRHGDVHEVILGETYASPGYRAGSLPAGGWTAFVDTHMVMPGPPCDICLEVTGIDLEAAGQAQDLTLPAAGVTASRGPGWYRGDLHAHTIHSDALWDVSGLITWSRARRLDFATLSDHNTVSGLPAMDAACSGSLLTMGGMELTTFRGHALALGVRGWVDWYTNPPGRTMTQIAQEVTARGGLFIIAHPAAIGDPDCTGCQWGYPEMMPGAAHVVEVWNSDWRSESNDELGLELVYTWLNQGLRLALTAGTDNHGRDPDAMHYGFDIVYAEDLTEKEILRAVRAGHLYLSAGPILELEAAVEPRRAGMGDVLDAAPSSSIRLDVAWRDCPPGAQFDLILDGTSREHFLAAAQGSRTLDLVGGQAHWCLLTLRAPDGLMLAMTNPIYFDGRA